jgi:PAS domain S-box-containing protein
MDGVVMDMPPSHALKKLTLLYVEDDVDTREELAMMLQSCVAELHVACDGQEGLALFIKHRPDIVVTDIQMPIMTGLAMSADIRRLEPAQPIVVVSAYNDVEYLFRAIELGIDHYVTKPISVERLLDKLSQMAEVTLALKERRRSLALLEQYKHLVDESAFVCKLDSDGVITYVNRKLCDISECEPADLVGRDLAALRSNGQRGEGWAVAKAGEKWTGISRNKTQSGRTYVVESSLVPILSEDGQLLEVVSLDVDISTIYSDYENLSSALDDSDRSLREQRHFLTEYKRALDSGTCVCVTDQSCRLISINPQFEALLGYTSRELKGRPLQHIASELTVEHCLGQVSAAQDEPLANQIVRFKAKNNRLLHFSVSGVAVRKLGGDIESFILICQDVTESMRLSRDIVETQRELLYMLGDVVESRSQETGQHVKRVAVVSRFLALEVGLDAATAELIETAAPMHDIGKVGIRDAILNKPGKYSPEEFDEMKHHASIGHAILGKVERPLIKLAAVIAQQHHERWDGKGYPFGLAGDAISMAGRIVAIADVLDALSSSRVYKPAWEEARVLDYFREQRGLQFDPNLVDILLSHWETIKALRDENTPA